MWASYSVCINDCSQPTQWVRRWKVVKINSSQQPLCLFILFKILNLRCPLSNLMIKHSCLLAEEWSYHLNCQKGYKSVNYLVKTQWAASHLINNLACCLNVWFSDEMLSVWLLGLNNLLAHSGMTVSWNLLCRGQDFQTQLVFLGHSVLDARICPFPCCSKITGLAPKDTSLTLKKHEVFTVMKGVFFAARCFFALWLCRQTFISCLGQKGT